MEELTILDRAIRLQKVELFSDLETELLALVASIARQEHVEAGQVLVEHDHVLDSLYVVLEGCIDMQRGGRTLFTVDPDETIGNWALFDRQPSIVRAVAAEPTWLLRIDRDDFYDLLADHSDMTRELFYALFKRVRSLLAAGLGSSADGSP